jgi:hypothetical protein
MKEKQSKEPLGFNPSVPKKPADKTQVGPLPAEDPHHKSPELKSEIDRSKSSQHRSE